MESVDILWIVLGILYVLGNVCGIWMFNHLEHEDFNPHKNKVSYWIITAFLAVIGFIYTIIQTVGKLINLIKKK